MDWCAEIDVKCKGVKSRGKNWSCGNMNVIFMPSPGLGRLRVGGLASQNP